MRYRRWQRDAGDEYVRDGLGMGANLLRVRVRGRAEQRCFERVGEERTTADYGVATRFSAIVGRLSPLKDLPETTGARRQGVHYVHI